MDELEALQTLIMEEIRQSEEKFEEFKNDLDLITRDKENTVKRNHKNVEDERNKVMKQYKECVNNNEFIIFILILLCFSCLI